MKLLSASQIRNWDKYTIDHESISSINLMERASALATKWITKHTQAKKFFIFCGEGNNGGDGLSIARMLYKHQKNVNVFILKNNSKQTTEFKFNLRRLRSETTIDILYLEPQQKLFPIDQDAIIIDALFGTGLNRALEGLASKLVLHINNANCPIVSIDIPSGMLCDRPSENFIKIKATHTLTFQSLKLAFFIPENANSFGTVHKLDIGLTSSYLNNIKTQFEIIDSSLINSLYKPRNKFSHKGDYGHALLMAGSYGKIGAALLSTKACLRSGAGLVTCYIPKCGYEIIQLGAPEAMCFTTKKKKFLTKAKFNIASYSSMGIGPGVGRKSSTQKLLHQIITQYKKPIVVDADALNILSIKREWISLLPENSILTPHPKEFERLFGKTKNDFEKLSVAMEKSIELKIIILLKGHNTFIAIPSGIGYFNTTGNAGMATGGSGDVLTGIITGLLAQDYSPKEAAILGVYLHGVAGDKAAKLFGTEAMVGGDIASSL